MTLRDTLYIAFIYNFICGWLGLPSPVNTSLMCLV